MAENTMARTPEQQEQAVAEYLLSYVDQDEEMNWILTPDYSVQECTALMDIPQGRVETIFKMFSNDLSTIPLQTENEDLSILREALGRNKGSAND